MATLTATLFAGIAKQRVNKKQPPSEGVDIDVERVSAIHNTLILYGWVCSGKQISALHKKSWWSRHGNEKLKAILRPKVVRYLSKIFDVPGHSFFYHVSGLASPTEMLQLGEILEDQDRDAYKTEKYRFIILYTSSKALVSQPAGIVLDQQTGKALLMPTYNHLFDLKQGYLPWQRLETILSAYIDMVESEKAVAITGTVFDPEAGATHPKPELESNRDFARYQTLPWILQPYTIKDLEACLAVWKRLVETLEKRAESNKDKTAEQEASKSDSSDEGPLCSKTALNVAGIPGGFAYELLSHARQSHIWFIAPGIRLPKVEEFLKQPFKHILQRYPKETQGMKMPFLFLRIPGTVSAKEAKFRFPFSTVDAVPCGLYLDAFANAQNPFEDACRLVLPIQLGNNKYARTSDFRPIRKSYSDLYQIEINPFVMRHGPKLVAVLENWLQNIESGHWNVNEKGVEGGIGVWRQADTRESWWMYQSGHVFV